MELSKLDGDLEILIEYSEVPTIRLRGELDFRNMDRVKSTICALTERGKHLINVDLGELVFMDSTGVSALVDAAKAMIPKGGMLRLLSPGEQLVRMLSASGFSKVFHYDSTRATHAGQSCASHPDERTSVEFEVPNKPEMIAYIRSRVADFACGLPFTDADIEDIKLAVGEASSNAIRHGCNPEWSWVGVRMERQKDRLKVVIYDKGCGFDPDTVCLAEPGDLAEGGRGIMFMRALMDEVEFSFKCPGTSVEMTKICRARVVN